MAVFERLFEASFKGATFLVNGSVETTGGRKVVDHLYPNSPRRFIEDLDLLRKDFSITGIIREPRYHAKRDLLIKKLESEGPGQFVHPFLGKFVVVAKPYVLTEDTTELGRAQFRLTFSVADNNIFPADGGANKFVKFLSDVQDAVDAFVEGTFGADASENFGPAGAVLGDIVDGFEAVQRTVAVIADGVNAFQDGLVQFKNRINSFVQGNENLGIAINNLFNNFGTITENALDRVRSFEDIFGFTSEPRTVFSKTNKFGIVREEDDPITLLDTTIISSSDIVPEDKLSQMQPLGSQRQENLQNVNTINIVMNISALSQMYFFAQQVTYTSDEALLEVSDRLESRFLQLVDILNEELLDSLENLRNEWRKFVDKELLTIDRVIEIEVEETNVTTLVNDLYGDTDKYEQIIDLNQIINPSEVSGVLRVIAT